MQIDTAQQPAAGQGHAHRDAALRVGPLPQAQRAVLAAQFQRQAGQRLAVQQGLRSEGAADPDRLPGGLQVQVQVGRRRLAAGRRQFDAGVLGVTLTPGQTAGLHRGPGGAHVGCGLDLPEVDRHLVGRQFDVKRRELGPAGGGACGWLQPQ